MPGLSRGNNAIAFIDSEYNTAWQSDVDRVFHYAYDTSLGPKAGANMPAAVVNAFYIINSVHDFTYRYGFTENAFNFQANNFGQGGSGNDRVLVSVQNDEGFNNAKFFTPPEYVLASIGFGFVNADLLSVVKAASARCTFGTNPWYVN